MTFNSLEISSQFMARLKLKEDEERDRKLKEADEIKNKISASVSTTLAREYPKLCNMINDWLANGSEAKLNADRFWRSGTIYEDYFCRIPIKFNSVCQEHSSHTNETVWKDSNFVALQAQYQDVCDMSYGYGKLTLIRKRNL